MRRYTDVSVTLQVVRGGCAAAGTFVTSGEVGTIFNGFGVLGIHGWRDMSQKNITMQGITETIMASRLVMCDMGSQRVPCRALALD